MRETKKDARAAAPSSRTNPLGRLPLVGGSRGAVCLHGGRLPAPDPRRPLRRMADRGPLPLRDRHLPRHRAVFRYAVFYQVSSQRIRIISGLGAKWSREILLDQLRSVTVRREMLNRFFNLGSLEFTPRKENAEPAVLKGVPDPDRLKRQVDLLAGLRETAR